MGPGRPEPPPTLFTASASGAVWARAEPLGLEEPVKARSYDEPKSGGRIRSPHGVHAKPNRRTLGCLQPCPSAPQTAERGSHISAQKEQRGPCSFTGLEAERGRRKGPCWAHGGPGGCGQWVPRLGQLRKASVKSCAVEACGQSNRPRRAVPSLHRLSALCPSTRRCKEAAFPHASPAT